MPLQESEMLNWWVFSHEFAIHDSVHVCLANRFILASFCSLSDYKWNVAAKEDAYQISCLDVFGTKAEVSLRGDEYCSAA
jgi:hypothetical protein